MRRLLREPLLHFALLGGVIFGAYRVASPRRDDRAEIIVTTDRIASLSAQFSIMHEGRPPREDELRTAIDAYVREEMLYREGLALGGGGEPIEWAVEMQRFDENATLDRLADRGKIDAGLADGLARVVAAAHDRAPRANAGAWIEELAQFIAQNDAAFRDAPALFRGR